jgi:hypothetical protein
MKRTLSVEPFIQVFPIGAIARLTPFRTGFVICNRIKSRGKILSMHTLGRSAMVTSPSL